MALTYANTEIIFRASRTMIYTEITFDTSYLTGGEVLTPDQVGLREISHIIPGSAEGFDVECIKTNPSSWLIQAFSNSGSTNTTIEFASALDRSGLTVDLLIFGR